MNERMLILGAGGLMGFEIQRVARDQGLDVVAYDRAACDITSEVQVRGAITAAAAGVVINCAAYNAVDRAEVDVDRALLANAQGAACVAAAAEQVVHFSTDFVFDGRKDSPYVEADPPRPISAYGRSKAAGDEAVQRANPRHVLLRVGCLYGAKGKGFGSTLLTRLRAGEQVKADAERRVQPTWGRHVAEQTLAIIGAHRHGLYHVMCHGDTTWAEFARECARLAGLDPRLVEGVRTDALLAAAPRPRYAVLENRALAALGLDRMPSWQEALTGYLGESLQGGAQK